MLSDYVMAVGPPPILHWEPNVVNQTAYILNVSLQEKKEMPEKNKMKILPERVKSFECLRGGSDLLCVKDDRNVLDNLSVRDIIGDSPGKLAIGWFWF